MAYAVFENFQLADYGNRIPSLTFELLAGDAAVTTGSVAAELSGGLVSGAGAALTGVSAYGDSVRGVLETLAAADGSWFATDGDALVLRNTAIADATLADDGSAATGDAPGRKRAVAAIESVPRAITLAHYDPARDYQIGLQRAVRPGPGTAEQRIDLPAAAGAGVAKALAETALARAESGRETRTVKAGWSALGTAPGACIAIGGVAGLWRVSGWSLEKMVLALDCVRLAEGSAVAVAADPGRVVSAPDRVIGTTILHAFEIPPLDDTLLSAPRLTIAAAGSGAGWRSAALLYSLDGGASWLGADATAAPAVVGTIVTPPGAAGAAIRDLRSSIEIELAHDAMSLAGADDGALDQGANIALAGDELIQFGEAVQIAARRWRLSRLLRGRRGTEAAAGSQAAGDRFVLIERDTARGIDLPVSMLGGTVRVMASGVGDGDGPVAADVTIYGASVFPPSPAHQAAGAPDEDGAVTLNWVRRSRAGWRWIDGGDAPLGEESELYRVVLTLGDGSARTIEASAPEASVSATDRASGAVHVAVRQVGTFGESDAAAIEIS